MPGQDQYIAIPDGSYVHVPGDATPEQLSQLRTKLGSMQPKGDAISQQAESAAKSAGAPTGPAPQPVTSANINKKGLFGEDISPQEEERIQARAENVKSHSITPMTNASGLLFPGASIGAAAASEITPHVTKSPLANAIAPIVGGVVGHGIETTIPRIGNELSRLSVEAPEGVKVPGTGISVKRGPDPEVAKTIGARESGTVSKSIMGDTPRTTPRGGAATGGPGWTRGGSPGASIQTPEPPAATPEPTPYKPTGITKKSIPGDFSRSTPRGGPATGGAGWTPKGRIGASIGEESPTIEPRSASIGRQVFPEPNQKLPGIPNNMGSIPREELEEMAARGVPGAFEQLQSLGKPGLLIKPRPTIGAK